MCALNTFKWLIVHYVLLKSEKKEHIFRKNVTFVEKHNANLHGTVYLYVNYVLIIHYVFRFLIKSAKMCILPFECRIHTRIRTYLQEVFLFSEISWPIFAWKIRRNRNHDHLYIGHVCSALHTQYLKEWKWHVLNRVIA